tara:strand:+ start:749 stop:1459 length:711 start_codon:yes stop_codon:yes gene_type:complete
MINAVQNSLFYLSPTIMTFADGEKIRIIGGKHKGKWGYVLREMPEFCLCRLMEYKTSKAMGDDEDLIVEKQVRAKTTYVEAIPTTVFEMPEDNTSGTSLGFAPIEPPQVPVATKTKTKTKGTQTTGPNPMIPLDKEVGTKMDAIIEDLLMGVPANDDDLLSHHSDEEPVDITDVLPSIDEALEMKHQNLKNKKVLDEMTSEIFKLSTEKNELAEALELFVKLADFLRGRLQDKVNF